MDACTGSKWSLLALWRHLREQRGMSAAEVDKVWAEMKEVVVKTFIAAEGHFATQMGLLNLKRHACFEIWGVDVLLDAHMKPWLVEVNTCPDLSASSPLDRAIKGTLFTDTFTLVGVPVSSRAPPAPPASRHHARQRSRARGAVGVCAERQGRRTARARGAGAAGPPRRRRRRGPARGLARRRAPAATRGPAGARRVVRRLDVCRAGRLPRPPKPRKGGGAGVPGLRGVHDPRGARRLQAMVRESEDEFRRQEEATHFQRLFPPVDRASHERLAALFETQRASNRRLLAWVRPATPHPNPDPAQEGLARNK
jgi:hypothetical protein